MEGTWAFDAPESEEEQFKMRTFKIDINFEKQIPFMGSAGLWLLIHFYGEYATKSLQEPHTVIKATAKYFSDNDIYKKFLDENIEIVVINGSKTPEKPEGERDMNVRVPLTDMYQVFKGWARSNFNSLKAPDQPVFAYHMLQRLGKPTKKEYYGIRIKELVDDKIAHI